MIQPAHHLFKVIKGATFDFRFQYLIGPQESIVPQPLAAYSANWTISSLDGLTNYFVFNTPSWPGTSGIFFGGDLRDPRNGIIDLVLTDDDTAAITWSTAKYSFAVTTPALAVIPLLTGNMGIVGSLP